MVDFLWGKWFGRKYYNQLLAPATAPVLEVQASHSASSWIRGVCLGVNIPPVVICLSTKSPNSSVLAIFHVEELVGWEKCLFFCWILSFCGKMFWSKRSLIILRSNLEVASSVTGCFLKTRSFSTNPFEQCKKTSWFSVRKALSNGVVEIHGDIGIQEFVAGHSVLRSHLHGWVLQMYCIFYCTKVMTNLILIVVVSKKICWIGLP